MKKAICIALCCVFAASLVAVPVFATSVPETTAAPNVFGTLFSSSDLVGYRFTINSTSQILVGSTNTLTLAQDYTFPTIYTSNVVGHAGDTFYFMKPSEEYILYINGVSTNGAVRPGTTPLTFVVVESSYGSLVGDPVYSSANGLVPELADEVFAVGGGLISFVMSNAIVLIPVVAFLVILCIGVIRKTVKGA